MDAARNLENGEDGRHANSLSKGALIVNGQKLQILRQQAGLTQEQLAEKAGYSDRLIRKAEASGPLRKSTVTGLAKALSTAERRITALDLTFSHEQLTRDLISILLTGVVDEFSVVNRFLHPECRMSVIGAELSIPFAGEYCGPSAVLNFHRRMRSLFAATATVGNLIRVYTLATETCADVSLTMLRNDSSESAQVFWFLKVQFETNQIRFLELMYDTGVICRLIENAAVL